MKKVFAIALLPFYLLAIVGFSSNVHHCAGKVSIEILGINFNKTCNCNHLDKNHSSDCCQDNEIHIKAIDSEKIASKVIDAPVKSIESVLFRNQIVKIEYSLFSLVEFLNYYASDHPPKTFNCIYLLNRVFLI